MTTIFDTMQEVTAQDMMLEIEFPKSKPVIKLKVQRFSLAEQDQATFKAEGILKDQGVIQETNDAEGYANSYANSYFYSLAEFVLRHLKGWEWMDPEQQKARPFNPANMRFFISALRMADRMDIGCSYWRLTDPRAKKNETNETEATAADS